MVAILFRSGARAVVLAALVTIASPAAALLNNPSFEVVGPLGPSTTNSTAAPGGAGASAADGWGVFHNTAGTTFTSLLPTTLPGAVGRMIHVRTDGQDNGLTNVFAPFNTGPTHVVSGVWVFVVDGQVKIGTGNGGNTGEDAASTTLGAWEYLQAPNGVSPANEFILYSKGGPAVFYADVASTVVPQEPLDDRPVEYSNTLDEDSVAAGGAHAGPDPGQTLYTEVSDAPGAPFPIGGTDFFPFIEDSEEPDAQIDALANGRDALFQAVIANTAQLVVSLRSDPVTPAGTDRVALFREDVNGATGVHEFYRDLHADHVAGEIEEVDAIELWGPLGSDADYYSLEGDIAGVAVYYDNGGGPVPWLTSGVVGGALVSLGFPAGAAFDVDALMVNDLGVPGTWDAGDEVLFSIKASAGWHGGEIVHWRFGAAPGFLFHGGHDWDSSFSVGFALTGEADARDDVDALEAILAGQPCEVDEDCVDADVCTRDRCENSVCVYYAEPDTDADGYCDPIDTCVVWPNPGNVDTDNNGIGDECECGDQGGPGGSGAGFQDGTVSLFDLFAVNDAILNPALVTPLCDTNEDNLCNLLDLFGVNDKILGAPAYCSRYPDPGP